jgi:exonuclease SbcD
VRFRFVHAADLHLDTPFAGVARVDERLAQRLRDASLEAWDALVELTLREEAAFLLLAGDVYDGERRGLRAQMRLLAGLRRLTEGGVRVFLVHGNHDPVGGGWSAVAAWPDGVTVFGPDRVEAVAVERDGRTVAQVYGVSFREAEERRNLARLFARGAGRGLHVGLLHANVGGDAEHGHYAPCGVEDLAAAGMDYWALGHVHRHRVVAAGDPCWAVYPGCLQGRSPAPGELGPKGAVVVECDDERGVLGPPRFVALDRVRFLPLEVDVAEARDVAAALGAVDRALSGLREDPAHAGRGLLVRLTLAGEPPCGRELEAVVQSGEFLQQVREQAEGLEPFVWCESVHHRLRGFPARDRLAGRGDLAAELVARADELAGDPGLLASLLRQLDAELPAPARLAAGTPHPRELLAAAEERCLRLLLEADDAS